MAPLKKIQKGGCGCVGSMPQSGGSLASSAVVELVPDHAWASLNTSNSFDSMSGGGMVNPAEMLNHTLVRNAVAFLHKPVTGGSSHTLDSLLTSSLAGPLKKNYVQTVRKYTNKKHQGGGVAAGGNDSLMSYLSPNFTSVISKLIAKGGSGFAGVGGGEEGEPLDILKMIESNVNPIMDHLTPHGAKKMGELLHDTKLFDTGISIASYLKMITEFVPSKMTQNTAEKAMIQHGGMALNIMSSLSAVNLEKVASLVGGKSVLNAILQVFKPPTLKLKKSTKQTQNTTQIKKKSSPKFKGGDGLASSGLNQESNRYMHLAYPVTEAVNRPAAYSAATNMGNINTLKYGNLLPGNNAGNNRTIMPNPMAQFLPHSMLGKNNAVSISFGGKGDKKK